MSRKIAAPLIVLALLILLPAAVMAQAPRAEEIAGEWEVNASLESDTVSGGWSADESLQVVLEIDEDGSGTFFILDLPGDLTYQDGVISGSLFISEEIEEGETLSMEVSLEGIVSREGDQVTIEGELSASLGGYSGSADYSWSVSKEIPPLEGESGAGVTATGEGSAGGEQEPGAAESPSGNINWDFECDCEEEPWERHAGTAGAAAISVIAALGALLGGAGGSAAAAAGTAAETLGAAFPETGAPDVTEVPAEESEAAGEEEREGEPDDDYTLPPESGYGGPDENPFTSFLSGKGPGDCVRYGLPRYWINTASLNLVIGDTFFESRGLGPEISLTLSYNSASKGGGIFGCGWSFSYEWLLEQKGDQVWVSKGSGQGFPFTAAGGATPEQPVEARPPVGIFHRLIDYGDHWLYIEKGAPLYQRFDRVPGMNLGRLTAVSDYYGNSIRLGYSSRGNLEKLTDAAGRAIHFTFNEKNLCTGFALPDGRRAAFSYDEQGRLVRTEDLMGIPVDYEYDAGSALTKMVTGKSERTVAFTYRQVGSERLLGSFSDPNGNITRYELLSAAPRRVAVTDPEGNKTVFRSRGGLTGQVTDPLGRAASMEYRGGLPVKYRDRNGGLMRWEYDEVGNQVKEINQAGEALIFAYDPFGNLTGITDPLGGRWAYRYNDRHSLVEITSPAGRHMSIEYSEQGLPVSLTGFDGLKTAVEHDRYGNIVQVAAPPGGITAFTFDEQGYLPTAVTDPLGHSVTFEHDGNGRLLRYRYPDGAEKSMVFDCCYNLLTTDERGLSRGYERDANGNILKEINASQAAGELVYDGNNNPLSLLNSCRQLTRYRYDAASRLDRVTNALGQNQFFNYDPAGNLVSYQPEGGGETALRYDPCHRPAGVTDPLGASTVLKRDAMGRVIEEKDARGKRVEFAYDPDGLLEKVFHDGQEAARYIYDSGGRLTGISDQSGTLTYDYSETGEFTATTYPDGSVLSTSSNKAGLLESITYPGGLAVRYRYDSRLRPAEMSWPGGWVKYGYDPAGNLVKEERSNGTESIYKYDQDERMNELKHSHGGEPFIERRYRRNASGSILEEESVSPLNPPPDQDFSLSCNPAGQMAGPEPFRYDGAGNLVEGPGWEAAYDGENRLVGLSRGGVTKRFHYNGLGHLVRVDRGEDSLEYGCDPFGNLMFERRPGSNPGRFYLYCHSRPVALVDEEAGTLFYHYDQGGNTLALTDSDGSLAAGYAYSPFGTLVSQGKTVGNPFTFCGGFGVLDQEEGLYFMKRRFYSAGWGRFLQKDPLGFEGGTNPYVYAANNPLAHIDPDGTVLLHAWAAWKAVGAVVGAITLTYAATKTAQSAYNAADRFKKRREALKKMEQAFTEYAKICKTKGTTGAEREAAYQRYKGFYLEAAGHTNGMLQGTQDTITYGLETAAGAVTPDYLALPAADASALLIDRSPPDPCAGGGGNYSLRLSPRLVSQFLFE